MLDYKTVFGTLEVPAVLAAAQAYARGRVGAAGVVTLDILQEGVITAMKKLAVDKLKPGLEGLLAESVASFQVFNGERPIGPVVADQHVDAPAWRDAFDEHLLNDIGADLQKAVGPSAIGEHFTDADVDDPEVREKVVHEMAERLAESAMVMDVSDEKDVKLDVAKTMALAGINDTMLASLLPAGAAPVAAREELIDEPTARAAVERIVGAWAIARGEAFDPIVLAELLDTAFEDDHFISLGAIERLAGKATDRPYFLAYAKAAPLECKGATLNAALAALASGQTVEPPKKKPGGRIKIEKAGATSPGSQVAGAVPTPPATPPLPAPPALPSTPGQAVAGDYASIVSIWRTHAKDTDQTIGEHIGVSRPQVGNIATGKAKLPLTVTKRAELKALLLNKAAHLQQAATLLD